MEKAQQATKESKSPCELDTETDPPYWQSERERAEILYDVT